jgi:hypothetical protein
MMALLPTMADHEVAIVFSSLVHMNSQVAPEILSQVLQIGPKESFSPGIMADLQAALSVIEQQQEQQEQQEQQVEEEYAQQQSPAANASQSITGSSGGRNGSSWDIMQGRMHEPGWQQRQQQQQPARRRRKQLVMTSVDRRRSRSSPDGSTREVSNSSTNQERVAVDVDSLIDQAREDIGAQEWWHQQQPSQQQQQGKTTGLASDVHGDSNSADRGDDHLTPEIARGIAKQLAIVEELVRNSS